MFYKTFNTEIYRGTKRGMPNVKESNFKEDVRKVSIELTRILDLLSKPTDENNQVGFFLDNVAPTFCEMYINTIIGDGPRVSVPDNAEAEDKIRDWNSKINLNGDTIEDWMRWFFLDNIQFNRSYSRIATNLRGIDGEYIPRVDLQRLDPKTIKVRNDDVNGWKKFVQTTHGTAKFKSAKDFIDDKLIIGEYGSYTITIPDDQRLLLHGNLFARPPMDAILPYIILKYWIMTFMKKYADRSWSGLFLAFIGDPKTTQYPRDPITMQDAINKTTIALNQMRNFGSASFPGDTRVEKIDPPNNGSIYSEWFEKMNKEIMFGLFSSMASRESSGVYKGNQIADESTVQFMRGIRNKMANLLKRFYVMNICPEVKETDIIFTWQELRVASIDTIASAIEKLSKLGIFIDAAEKRRAASQIFTWLQDRHLTDEDISRLNDEFIELNKPSAPAEGNVAKTKNNSEDKQQTVPA